MPLLAVRNCNCRAGVVQPSHGPREGGSDLYESHSRARVRADACSVTRVPPLAAGVWKMRVEEAHQASSYLPLIVRPRPSFARHHAK